MESREAKSGVLEPCLGAALKFHLNNICPSAFRNFSIYVKRYHNILCCQGKMWRFPEKPRNL
jgi:hypothetical protein